MTTLLIIWLAIQLPGGIILGRLLASRNGYPADSHVMAIGESSEQDEDGQEQGNGDGGEQLVHAGAV